MFGAIWSVSAFHLLTVKEKVVVKHEVVVDPLCQKSINIFSVLFIFESFVYKYFIFDFASTKCIISRVWTKSGSEFIRPVPRNSEYNGRNCIDCHAT